MLVSHADFALFLENAVQNLRGGHTINPLSLGASFLMLPESYFMALELKSSVAIRVFAC
jgi:hypothetical protein